MLVTISQSGFFGSTQIDASLLEPTRVSFDSAVQVSPPSSDR